MPGKYILVNPDWVNLPCQGSAPAVTASPTASILFAVILGQP